MLALSLWVLGAGGCASPRYDATLAASPSRDHRVDRGGGESLSPAFGEAGGRRADGRSRALKALLAETTARAKAPAPTGASSPETKAVSRTQPPESAVALSLEDVVEAAFRANPTFGEFAARRDAARAGLIEAMAWRNPELGLRYGQVMGRAEPGARGDAYGVSLEQPLELTRKRQARREVARAGIETAEREEAVFRAELRAEVARAWHTAFHHETAAALLRETLSLTRRMEEVVERRIEAGEAPAHDAARARIETLQTQRRLGIEESRAGVARTALETLCARSLPSPYRLASPDADAGASPMAVAHIPSMEWFEEALDVHPRLMELESARRQAESEWRLARANRYPDPRPGLGFERGPDDDTIGLSLGIEIPVWSRQRGAIERAEAEIQRLEAEIERAEEDILGRVATAWREVVAAREQLEWLDEMRRAARETLETEAFLHEQGETELLVWLDALRTVRELELETLNVRHDAALAETALIQALGLAAPGGLQP